MNKIFTEFENENALQWYPFASGQNIVDTNGQEIGTGILIDAALYPVNPNGDLYLSRIGVDGTVSISDDSSVVMTAVAESGSSALEFYDLSELHRHVGTVLASSADALSALVNVYEDRVFRKENALFASSCVFPIVNDGVLTVNVGGTGAVDGTVEFANSSTDAVRVSVGDGHELRFDVIPSPPRVLLESIQHVFCIVDGKTPFRIMKLPFGDMPTGLGNTVAVYLDNIDRQAVCSDAHREDTLEMKDTCECESSSSGCDELEPPVDIEDVYQVEVVDIPNRADSAFYLAVPNMTGYDNPLSLTLNDSLASPKTKVTGETEDTVGISVTGETSRGVVFQVPGLGSRT